MLSLASTNLGVPVSSLTVANGVVSGGGKSVTYGALVGGQLLGATIPSSASGLHAGQAPAKPISSLKIVTLSLSPPRIDIPAKVTGHYIYVHNVRVPGMLHGRIVRPRGRGAYGADGNALVSYDASSISHIPVAPILILR
jgi:hypothetical protein